MYQQIFRALNLKLGASWLNSPISIIFVQNRSTNKGCLNISCIFQLFRHVPKPGVLQNQRPKLQDAMLQVCCSSLCRLVSDVQIEPSTILVRHIDCCFKNSSIAVPRGNICCYIIAYIYIVYIHIYIHIYIYIYVWYMIYHIYIL